MVNMWVLSGGRSVRVGGGHLGGLLLYLFWAINLWYSIWESNCSSSCLVRSASWWFPTAMRNVHVMLTHCDWHFGGHAKLHLQGSYDIHVTFLRRLSFFGHAKLHLQGSFDINVTLMHRDRQWMASIVIGQTTLHLPRLKEALIYNLW